MKKVVNKNRRKFESEHYHFVVLKKYGVREKLPCMFTDIELSDMEKIKAPWLRLRKDVLYETMIARKQTYLWYSKKLGHIFRISPYQLGRATERAANNPEDFPQETLFRKLAFWK